MTTNDSTTARTGRASIQKGTALIGIVFLAVGVAGFIPGITTSYSELKFASHLSGAQLFGIFQVSVLHNIVHLLFGIAGIALSRTWDSARTYLLGAGVIYLVLFVYGLLVGNNDDANFVPINNPDDFLHLVLGLALLAGWFVSKAEPVGDRTAPTTPMP
jgi:Domain of unknown function (DUF4383)